MLYLLFKFRSDLGFLVYQVLYLLCYSSSQQAQGSIDNRNIDVFRFTAEFFVSNHQLKLILFGS